MSVLKNPKHEIVAQALATGQGVNGSYAAAGYKPDAGNASRLAALPAIQARVVEITTEAAARTGVTVEAIVAELAKVGFSNMLDYVRIDPEGQPRIVLEALSRDQAAAIQSIDVTTRTEHGGEDRPDANVTAVRFKLGDKRAALVDLGKHLGMFKERVEHTGSAGGPIQVNIAGDDKGLL